MALLRQSNTLRPQSRTSPDSALAESIDAIGTPEFGTKLLNYLQSFCTADHCAAFYLETNAVTRLAAGSLDGTDIAERQAKLYTTQNHWRSDPIMHQARQRLAHTSLSVVRADMRNILDNGLREAIYPQINDRVLLCGKKQGFELGLSVLRSDLSIGFSNEEFAKLNESAELLISLLAKHANILMSRPNVVRAVTCREEIEDCLITMTRFPKREVEVSARILHGMSSIGIALDLGLGEETVKTYRKRSYQRLRIGTERELLVWYLDLWSRWRGLSYTGSSRVPGINAIEYPTAGESVIDVPSRRIN